MGKDEDTRPWKTGKNAKVQRSHQVAPQSDWMLEQRNQNDASKGQNQSKVPNHLMHSLGSSLPTSPQTTSPRKQRFFFGARTSFIVSEFCVELLNCIWCIFCVLKVFKIWIWSEFVKHNMYESGALTALAKARAAQGKGWRKMKFVFRVLKRALWVRFLTKIW